MFYKYYLQNQNVLYIQVWEFARKKWFFSNESLVLRAICLNHERITHVALFYRVARAIRSQSLFCHEQPEWIAHCRSFLTSETRANHSQWRNNMSDFEQNSEFPTLCIFRAKFYWKSKMLPNDMGKLFSFSWTSIIKLIGKLCQK